MHGEGIEASVIPLIYSLANGQSIVPHAAFCDPRYPNESPRESVELRVLVVY
jgi:hypothetical protein